MRTERTIATDRQFCLGMGHLFVRLQPQGHLLVTTLRQVPNRIGRNQLIGRQCCRTHCVGQSSAEVID